MRILVYGSTLITQAVVERVRREHDLVGHVPSRDPFLPGRVPLPVVGEEVQHDLKLSLQFDRRIDHRGIGFNLHTGLLPDWAGCDILHHALSSPRASWQGLTFHRMTDRLDVGPVVARVEYPVLIGDGIEDLYRRMLALAPGFVSGALAIVAAEGIDGFGDFPSFPEPRTFRRGEVSDRERYRRDGESLREFAREWSEGKR
jgi:hypothetical protein